MVNNDWNVKGKNDKMSGYWNGGTDEKNGLYNYNKCIEGYSALGWFDVSIWWNLWI